MRNILWLTACSVILCLLPLSEARASISSNAQIAYFDSTNEVWGVRLDQSGLW